MAITAADIKKYALDPNLSYAQKAALAKQYGVSLGQIASATGLNQADLAKQARSELGVSSVGDLLKGVQGGSYDLNQAADLAYGIGGTPEERMATFRGAQPMLAGLRPWDTPNPGQTLVGERSSAGVLDQLIRGDITPDLAIGNILNPLRSFRSTGPGSMEERVGPNSYVPVTGQPFGSSGTDPKTGLMYQTTGPAWAGMNPYTDQPLGQSPPGFAYNDASWGSSPGGAKTGGSGGVGAVPNPGAPSGDFTLPNQIPSLPRPGASPIGNGGSIASAPWTQRGTANGLTTALPDTGAVPITGGGVMTGTAGQGWQTATGTPVPGFPGVNTRPGLPSPQELLPGPVTEPAQLGGAPMTDAKMLQLLHATLPVTDMMDQWLAPQQNEVARDITRAYQQNVFPSIGRNAVTMGNYGSSRHGIAEGIAGQSMGDAISREIAALRNNAYESAMNRSLAATGQLSQNELQRQQIALQGQLAALGLLPQEQASQFAGLDQIANIGNAYQQQQQAMINADKAQWDYWQNLPAQQLARYMAMIQGNVGQLGGTTSTSQSGGGGFSGSGALGGALGTTALAGMAPAGSALAGLAGTGGGIPLAVLGALFGGFL